MKKLVVGLALVSLIAIGAIAYAHGTGGWGGGGYMMGPMMGWGGSGYGYDQRFFNETTDLRKELHEKKFKYFEILRDPRTTPETIAKLEKEIRELQGKIHEKAPRTTYGRFGGYGTCW